MIESSLPMISLRQAKLVHSQEKPSVEPACEFVAVIAPHKVTHAGELASPCNNAGS